ncbi:LmeA family phospholipid-binding protein [Nocardiopsis dassonvillei]|uniref:LmeA family phospholipid-binding protein n=1 Tax=Nocardiopsis dassonvillei TaxID=2014 RepID=UPI00366FF477
MRKFLVVLLILLAVAVVAADIGARSFAQNMVASQLAQRLQMAEEPEVSIEGWAFLPQAVGGTYSEVNITAASATMDSITVEQIDVTATEVDAPPADLLNQPTVVAGQLDGSFTVPYSFFNAYLPEGITITTEGGQPRITGELAFPEFGISTSVNAGGEFSVEGDTVTVTPVDVQVGDAPVDLSGMAATMLTFSAQAPQLPFGLTVTEMEATSSGLRVTGTGSDVPLMGADAA